MAVDPARVKSLFLAASDFADPAERRAFLDRECGPDDSLRARVEALLRADQASAWPEGGVPDATATFGAVEPTGDCPGKDVHAGAVIAGKYTLVEAIGEGGMGTVWRARQTEPVKRFVALKLIKTGMDSRQVLARFEAERQALALMDHPNIAKVLDGGIHDGRPFFVMDLVKGVPITDFCDACKLTPQQRLELFVQACQAIQHAHQKGIIHRDIKPSNVLVALYDDKPVVKVIDFGVAKATGGTLTEKTIDTGFGGVVGTPQYMSPEQATFNNLDIDTRSDVYALGVLLYELLAGSPPFSRKELEKKGLLEMLRVVREEEPPRPSTKLSTADALPSLSANRGTEPKKLAGLLRNELDWIVMKALEKDRKRRYETANGFAADVQRYLSGEPVQAHPPSTAYRIKKFVRRHKGQVIAASLVLFALLTGVVGTSLGLLEAKKQERLAVEEAKKKEDALQAEQDARRKADEATELTAARLKQIETINNTVFDIFTEFDIRKVKEGKEPVEYVLAQKLIAAGKALDEKAIHDPLVLAKLRDRLGKTLLNLGEAPAAIELIAAAAESRKTKLGSDHPDTLVSMGNLAQGYQDAGRLDKGLPLLEETLQLMKAKLGPDHPDTLQSMNNLATGYHDAGRLDQALPLYEETLKLNKAKLGQNHPDTLTSMNNLASAYQAAGQLDKALPLLEETLRLTKAKLGPDHPDTLQSMNNLAMGYEDASQLDIALPLLEETLHLTRAKLGRDHPDTLTSMNNLASGYKAAGQLDKALPLLEETLRLTKAKLGPEHPSTLIRMNNLAEGYHAAGKLELALLLYEETLKLSKAKLGPDHPSTLAHMGNLALGYLDAGQFVKALPLLEETHRLTKAKLGPEHPATLGSMNSLASGYNAAGKRDLALPLLEETLHLRKAKLGPNHPDTLSSMGNLALGYMSAGKLDKALPLYEETLKLKKAKLGPDHPNTFFSMNNLATGYHAAGKLDLALPLWEETLKLRMAKLGPDHPDTLTSMNNLANGYKAAGKLDLALPLFEEAAQGIEKRKFRHQFAKGIVTNTIAAYASAKQHDQADAWRQKWLAFLKSDGQGESPAYANELAIRIMSLLQRKKFTEAEPLLRECIAVREKTQPDFWNTFNTYSMLGGALLGHKKYADAEPLLLKGYEGMKARGKDIPKTGGAELRIPEALDRLIELYTATDKPAEAAKYRDLRAAYPTPRPTAPPPREKK
jgi:serine/threonine protein kinase/tetratricopeptide (TPR) repeat protein